MPPPHTAIEAGRDPITALSHYIPRENLNADFSYCPTTLKDDPLNIRTRFLPTVSTLVAASFALTLSPAQALPSSLPKEEQPSPERSITESLTEYPSLDAAEDAADPGETIAYSPTSGNAIVLEDKEGEAATRTDTTILRYGFSIGCPGNGSEPNKIVDEFNAAYLGPTLLKCGSGKTGYEHISARHGQEWQDRLTAVGRTID